MVIFVNMLKNFALFLCFFAFLMAKSQTISKPLLNGNSFYFKSHIYVYGYEQSPKSLSFKCFRFNSKLQVTDSNEVILPNTKLNQLLDVNTDTLHNVINFYFQLANQKNVASLYRLNDTLEKICFIQNFDANHINSLSAFDDEKYYNNDDLYLVRTNSDSTGTQFYLSKYHVKSMNAPFEYDFKWQFAFERKFIHRASVIFADSNFLLLYANVFEGVKKGQWILRINAKNGQLIRGTKLNPKDDTHHYLLSNYVYDKKNKTLDVIGSIYLSDIVDFKNGNSNFKSVSKSHQLFLISIDSLGEIVSRTEKTLTLPIQPNKLNPSSTYHLKMNSFLKSADNNYTVWSTIYECKVPGILSYVSSWQFDIILTDIDYDITVSKFVNASSVLPNFISFDKGDPYGKFYLDSPKDYDRFKYKKLSNELLIKTGFDDMSNTFSILKKTTILKSACEFNYVSIGKKGLESKVLLKANSEQHPNLYFIKNMNYISVLSNVERTQIDLKLNYL